MQLIYKKRTKSALTRDIFVWKYFMGRLKGEGYPETKQIEEGKV